MGYSSTLGVLDIEKIKEDLNTRKFTNKELALKYHTSPTTIWRISHNYGNRHVKIEDSFYSKIQKDLITKCWIWLGYKDIDGYGNFRHGKYKMAHRYSYQLRYGSIDNNLQVLHRCDNPPCVNPEHLFLGTQKDNIRDCIGKKRRAKGEKCHRSKLKQAQVNSIKEELKYTKISVLANKYKVKYTTIYDISRGKTWK